MFTKGLLGYLPANIIQAVIGILTIVVFTTMLTPSQYGSYALAFSVFSLVHMLLFSWVEAAMARFWPAQKTPEDMADLYASLYALLIWIGGLVVPVSVALLLWGPIAATLKWPILLALISIPLRSFLNLIKHAMRARGDVAQSSFIDVSFILGAFIIGVAAIYMGTGAVGPMIGILIVPALLLPWALSKEARFKKGGQFQQTIFKDAFRYGYPISIALGLAVVLNSTDRFMLAYFLDEAAVGAYHASYSLANRTLDILFVWLGMAGVPAMVMALEKDGPAALKQAASQHANVLILITLPAAVGVALVARPFSEVLIGPDLRDASASVTPLIAFSGFLGGMLFYYFNQAFVLAQKTSLLLISMLVPVVANIGLNLVLIPSLGLYGAAVATVLSFAIAIASSVLFSARLVSVPFPAKPLWTCGLCCVAMAASVWWIPDYGGILELALKASVGAVVYGLCAYAINAADVRRLAREIMQMLRARKEARHA